MKGLSITGLETNSPVKMRTIVYSTRKQLFARKNKMLFTILLSDKFTNFISDTSIIRKDLYQHFLNIYTNQNYAQAHTT